MTEPIAAGRMPETPATNTGAHMRVAMLDTDSGFLQVLGKRLERLGWEHRVLASAVPVETVVAMRLNAIVIDLAVLGPQAWEYLEKLCASLPGLGVVVCTGQSTVAQRVRGLRMGADDWLTKPCHPEELLARVEAVVRRRRRAEAREERAPIQAGEVEIRADRFQAYVDDLSVDLTRREFELIELLAAAEGRVLEREEIYQRVWGYAMARGDRSVDVFVRKLRQKLEKASPDWRYIHTHFGVGYRFSPEAVEGSAAAAAIEAARRAEPVEDDAPVAPRAPRVSPEAGQDPGAAAGVSRGAVAVVSPVRLGGPARGGATPPAGRVPCGACRRPRCATSRSSLVLAAAVAFVPGGGDTATLIGALLSTAILACFVMLAARFYRENRMDVLWLPDRWRAIFYGALGVIVLAMAARPRLVETGGGLLLWLAAVAGSGYALYRVWRQYREYA